MAMASTEDEKSSEVGEVPVPHGGVEGHADDVVVRRLQPRDAVRVSLQVLAQQKRLSKQTLTSTPRGSDFPAGTLLLSRTCGIFRLHKLRKVASLRIEDDLLA